MSRCLFALVLVGCSSDPKPPSMEQAIADHAGAVEPKIAVAEAIDELPFGPAPDRVVLDGPPLELTYLSVGHAVPKSIGNATLVYEPDLADLTTEAKIEMRSADPLLRNALTTCASLVRKRAMPPGDRESEALKYLRICSALRYLVVVRKRSLTKPAVNMQAKTFTPGRFTGDVFVFSLGSGKSLGGFRLDVQQTASTVRGSGYEVETSFSSSVNSAIRDGLAKHAGAR